MSMYWQVLRAEWKNAVDDFREKGAVGTFRDVALDACDMAAGAGSAVLNGAKSVVASGATCEAVAVRANGMPGVGETVQMEMRNCQSIAAVVLAVDTIAIPPRVRVQREDTNDCLIVPVIKPGAPLAVPQSAQKSMGPELLYELNNQWRYTVEEFKTKGAAGALKDAALDTFDLLGNATQTAIGATKTVTGKTLDLLTGETEIPQTQRFGVRHNVVAPCVASAAAAGSNSTQSSQPVERSFDETVEGCLRQRQSKAPAGPVSTTQVQEAEEEELID